MHPKEQEVKKEQLTVKINPGDPRNKLLNDAQALGEPKENTIVDIEMKQKKKRGRPPNIVKSCLDNLKINQAAVEPKVKLNGVLSKKKRENKTIEKYK